MPLNTPAKMPAKVAFAFALTLAAALATPSFAAENEVVTAPDGSIEIVLKDGMNCHRLQCFTLDLQNGTVQWPGSVGIDLPEGIDLSSGRISPEVFKTILRAARNAPSAGVRQGTSGGGNEGSEGTGGGDGTGCIDPDNLEC